MIWCNHAEILFSLGAVLNIGSPNSCFFHFAVPQRSLGLLYIKIPRFSNDHSARPGKFLKYLFSALVKKISLILVSKEAALIPFSSLSLKLARNRLIFFRWANAIVPAATKFMEAWPNYLPTLPFQNKTTISDPLEVI